MDGARLHAAASSACLCIDITPHNHMIKIPPASQCSCSPLFIGRQFLYLGWGVDVLCCMLLHRHHPIQPHDKYPADFTMFIFTSIYRSAIRRFSMGNRCTMLHAAASSACLCIDTTPYNHMINIPPTSRCSYSPLFIGRQVVY